MEGGDYRLQAPVLHDVIGSSADMQLRDRQPHTLIAIFDTATCQYRQYVDAADCEQLKPGQGKRLFNL